MKNHIGYHFVVFVISSVLFPLVLFAEDKGIKFTDGSILSVKVPSQLSIEERDVSEADVARMFGGNASVELQKKFKKLVRIKGQSDDEVVMCLILQSASYKNNESLSDQQFFDTLNLFPQFKEMLSKIKSRSLEKKYFDCRNGSIIYVENQIPFSPGGSNVLAGKLVGDKYMLFNVMIPEGNTSMKKELEQISCSIN